ncbi:MAG: tetraacyldisaccharide 4'-kinase [Nitrospira sp.]|nr:tetraacyldisaccharide 4'-kinase [Nitrospira sp.]
MHYTHAMVETIRARASAGGVDMLVTTEKDADKVAPYLTGADVCWAVRLDGGVGAGSFGGTVATRWKKTAGHA